MNFNLKISEVLFLYIEKVIREKERMKYYIKCIGFILFEKEIYFF